MERFIVRDTLFVIDFIVFKIQYGEIYSVEKVHTAVENINLKSSMERFIEEKPLRSRKTSQI